MTVQSAGLVPTRAAYARRRRPACRARRAGQFVPRTPHIAVQPGQLTSPLLKSGFPSLALH